MSSRLSPGGHRQLCGDAPRGDDHRRLMGGAKIDAVITDPPYGVGIEYRSFNAVGRVLGGFSALNGRYTSRRSGGSPGPTGRSRQPIRHQRPMPDWAWMHRELRRPNVTLALHRRREAVCRLADRTGEVVEKPVA